MPIQMEVVRVLARFDQDLRHALRRLRASPGTAALAVALLGLAIGMSSSMFTVVDALILRPAPFGIRPRSWGWFGIRIALGATPTDVRRLVHGSSAILGSAGIAAGVVLAWILGRLLSAVQYQVRLGDPLTWTVVLTLVALTTALASWRPARQAMRVDPIALLRAE